MPVQNAELQRLNRAFGALCLCGSHIVRASSEGELLEALCHSLVEVGGYRMAWVGYPDGNRVRAVASAGAAATDTAYLRELFVGYSNDELGRGPTGTALRTGQPSINRDTETNPAYAPWKEKALLHGFRSSMALPLICEGETLGALAVYASEPDAFGADESAMLVRFAEDLSFGIGALRTRQALAKVELTLRDSEERFRQLAENVGVVFWLSDPANGRLLYISPAYETIWGRTCESLYAAPGDWLTALHPDDRERVQQTLREQARGAWAELYRIVRPDGALRWIRDRAYPVRDANGRVYRMAGIATDVTENRRLEEQLQQAQKIDAIGQLTGGIAHDFNNLLSVILSRISLLLEELPAGDPRREEAVEVKSAAERAAALTRQLLAFSRKQMLKPRVLDLNAVVAGLVPMLRRLIGEDVALRVTPAETLGFVKADAGQLEQVIMNLAVNARDAMRGGGTLTLQTADAAVSGDYGQAHFPLAAGDYVTLSVSDTGEGMSPEVQKHLFEPFFTTKAPGKGTGLGLSTSFGIVKQSGGYIWVYSEVGHGSVFRVYLPRVNEALQAPEPPRAPGNLRGTETLLLVDDDASVRAAAKRCLDSCGYNVLAAQDGAEALALCLQHQGPIALVVSDVVLPGSSGPQVVEQLRAARPGLAALFMSGFTGHALLDQGLGENANFLQKPFTPESLAGRVREILDDAKAG